MARWPTSRISASIFMSCKLEHLVFCNVIIVTNSDHLNVIKMSDTNESVKGDDIVLEVSVRNS